MRQLPHLKRNHRSGNWVFFRRFPLSVQKVVGRTFFERSLRTADRSAVAAAWRDASQEFDSIVEFAAAQDTLSQTSPIAPWFNRTQAVQYRGSLEKTRASLDLDIVTITDAVSRWGERERYQRSNRALNDPNFRADDAEFVKQCQMVGACGHRKSWVFHCPPLYALSQEITSGAGIDIPEMHGTLFVVQKLVEKELRSILELEGRWRQYDFSEMPKTRPANDRNNKFTLKEIVEKYLEFDRKPKKTASKLNLVARYIGDAIGENVPASAITKDQLRSLQISALKIPARLRKEERKLSFDDLIKLQITDSAIRPTLSAPAIRSWFNLLNGCLNWATANDLIERNPAQGVAIRVKETDESPRTSFEGPDFSRIFSTATYPKRQQSERYWLPLIALYTGARLNEIGQLLRKDIASDGIPRLIITDQSSVEGVSKRLKNKSSRRIIPIHSRLIELGILELAHGDGIRAFEALPHGTDYEPTKAFSQWFGRYLRRVGVSDRRKVFHSFRHSFKDACRRGGIPEEVHDALTGHVNRANIGRAYGTGVPLEVLADAIGRLNFGSVDPLCDLMA